jgi:hydrogenase 3 maturation protease
LAADKLERVLKNTSNVKIFVGATAPENLTGDIKKFNPSHILLIDSVDFKDVPGSVLVLNPRDLGDGVSFSTHKMPAKVLMQYFSNSLKCSTILVGIQPRTIDFGKPLSKKVISSVREMAGVIAKTAKLIRKRSAGRSAKIDKSL